MENIEMGSLPKTMNDSFSQIKGKVLSSVEFVLNVVQHEFHRAKHLSFYLTKGVIHGLGQAPHFDILHYPFKDSSSAATWFWQGSAECEPLDRWEESPCRFEGL